MYGNRQLDEEIADLPAEASTRISTRACRSSAGAFRHYPGDRVYSGVELFNRWGGLIAPYSARCVPHSYHSPSTRSSDEVNTPKGPVPTGFSPVSRQALIEAFGQPPKEVALVAFGRPRSWRVRGAGMRLLLTLVLAPLVAIIPPHAPWVVAVLVTGGILTRRRWTERLTIASFEGGCPRCDESLVLAEGTRLMNPHVLTCEGCHHTLTLNHSPIQPDQG